MRCFLATILAFAFLAAVPAAGAHPGNIWYTTPAKAAGNLESKFSSITTARCWPLQPFDRLRYGADSFVRRGARLWDHVICGVLLQSGEACLVVFHVTGRRWHQFILSSYRVRGCTPYQLRR